MFSIEMKSRYPKKKTPTSKEITAKFFFIKVKKNLWQPDSKYYIFWKPQTILEQSNQIFWLVSH